jgi:hypothetical protein
MVIQQDERFGSLQPWRTAPGWSKESACGIAAHEYHVPAPVGEIQDRLSIVGVSNEAQLDLWLSGMNADERDANSQGYQPSAESELCPGCHGLGGRSWYTKYNSFGGLCARAVRKNRVISLRIGPWTGSQYRQKRMGSSFFSVISRKT